MPGSSSCCSALAAEAISSDTNTVLPDFACPVTADRSRLGKHGFPLIDIRNASSDRSLSVVMR